MTREYDPFLWLVLVNFAVTILYLAFGICLRRKKEGVMQYILNAIVMLLCPVVGVLFFAMGTVIRHIFMRVDVNLEDVIFSKERVQEVLHADEERDRNIVPMEEALAVSDRSSLRRLMLNVIRGDVQNSLHSVSLGLNSRDSETAHYAASMLRDELNDFRVIVQQEYEKVMQEEDPEEERCRCACSLIELMIRILPQHVFTTLEQKSFVLRLDEVCEFLYVHRPEQMQLAYFENVILQLNELGDYSRAEQWCRRLAVQYPNELSAYTCPLKVYFASGQRKKFFELLAALKKSDIVLDHATLEMVRTLEPEKDQLVEGRVNVI